MSRDDAGLLDMLTSARLAHGFVSGLDKPAFLADLKTQSAVLHQLLVLGEAAKRVSPATRAKYPQIPWRGITGMRDNLIHNYDDVDLDEVWNTISADVPLLLRHLSPLVGPAPRSERRRLPSRRWRTEPWRLLFAKRA